MIKIKKTLSLLLAMLLLISVIPVSAVELTDSTATFEATEDFVVGNNPVEVKVTKASTYTITIPKVVILSGASNTATGEYTVRVAGDISGTEVIYVVPEDSFVLTQSGKNDITAIVEQTKTIWKYSNLNENGNGSIMAEGLSAGSWHGCFYFNISRNETSISVDAIDKNGNNLNATSTNIIGTEKDELLSKLEESKMVSSSEDVDAIIEVNSNEFDNLAETTFDVSNIAKEGDSIIILHYNEETSRWEFIANETVDENGKVTADFTSYSPVAFVVVQPDKELTIIIPSDPNNHGGIVPHNATYTTTDGTVLKEGNLFPYVVNRGDIYTYGEFIYCYGYGWCSDCENWSHLCNHKISYAGWTAHFIGTDDPGVILTSINNRNVKSMINAFANCETLTTVSNLFIPDCMLSMYYSFQNCTNLIAAPIIPQNVTNLDATFKGCTNLKTYVGSTDVDGDFSNYIIPDTVTNMHGTFSYCESITDSPIISKNVKHMYYIFNGCKNLTNINDLYIPATATNIAWAFGECTSLNGTIKIDANPEQYNNCFYKIDFRKQNITLTGTSPILDEIGKTGKGYCSECNGTCSHPQEHVALIDLTE